MKWCVKRLLVFLILMKMWSKNDEMVIESFNLRQRKNFNAQ